MHMLNIVRLSRLGDSHLLPGLHDMSDNMSDSMSDGMSDGMSDDILVYNAYT